MSCVQASTLSTVQLTVQLCTVAGNSAALWEEVKARQGNRERRPR